MAEPVTVTISYDVFKTMIRRLSFDNAITTLMDSYQCSRDRARFIYGEITREPDTHPSYIPTGE